MMEFFESYIKGNAINLIDFSNSFVYIQHQYLSNRSQFQGLRQVLIIFSLVLFFLYYFAFSFKSIKEFI